MAAAKKVLAISGSTRRESTNHNIIKGIGLLAAGLFEVCYFDGISALPHFNPDLTPGETPETVLAFRKLIAAADGILICTPEYAHGVPGTLKNAIDWTVGTADFDGKPTMLITAATDGREGHRSLLETLTVVQAKDVDKFQLLIPFARTKINHAFQFVDETLLNIVKGLVHTYNSALQVKK